MKKLLLLAFTTALFYSCKTETKKPEPITKGQFTFSSEYITANKPFEITYNGSEEIEESFYYSLKTARAYPYDLEFENNKAIITVPDSITALTFHFKIDNFYDGNAREGYFFKVKDANGKVSADAEASLQFYAMSYGEDYNISGGPKRALKAIENALETDPNLEERWMRWYPYTLQLLNSDKLESVGMTYINKLMVKDSLTLYDYETIESIAFSIRKDELRDSISKIIKQKFPNDDNIAVSYLQAFYETEGLKEKEAIFKSNQEIILKHRSAWNLVEFLAQANYDEGNTAPFYEYLELLENNTAKARLLNFIATKGIIENKNLETAKELAKQSLEYIKVEQNELSQKPEYLSLNQHKRDLEETYNRYADTYATLAYKNGNIKEAISYQAKATEKYAEANMNERYIDYLMADKQYEAVIENASRFIKVGNSTDNIKMLFKEAFAKIRKTDNVSSTIADLESKAKQRELANLKKKLIDEDAPDFTLKNLDGEDVTLSSLKGKIVILDFWATWCGPCIQSFPAMQSAVNNYKDNDDVEFLFINTLESGKTRLKAVEDFIKQKGYTFNVLIDPEMSINESVVAKQYNVQGIPLKIVIGPSGRINYKSLGFGGSEQQVLNEIDGLVQLLSPNLK